MDRSRADIIYAVRWYQVDQNSNVFSPIVNRVWRAFEMFSGENILWDMFSFREQIFGKSKP